VLRCRNFAYGFLLVYASLAFPACSSTAENGYYLEVGEQRLQIEIAATPEARSRGLMYRESLAEDAGMLFVFPDDRKRSFWMKNTSIPLSIAYIRHDGTISEILDMQPYSLDPVPSQRRVRYALEVNQGWFERKGVRAGMRVGLPGELPTAR
jgi:uncharacterized protein